MGAVLVALLAVSSVFAISWALRTFYWVWVKPKRMEKYLREQGINGPPYKLFYGNLKEMVGMMIEARSRPMELSHRIIPRVLPFFYHTVQGYGKLNLSWHGPNPRLNIMDPEMIRDILSNKFGHFGKMKSNPLGKLLTEGVSSYEGVKWVKHRKIITPAFHQEKLKSLTGDAISRTAFGSSYEEGRRVFQLQTEMAELVIQLGQSIYIPGFRFLPTKRNNRMKEIYREVKTLLGDMIKKREKAMKLGEPSTDDLLGLLMESNHKEIKDGGNAKNAGMSIDEVIEECKLFYIAGQETTSTLLLWTMVVLCMHPEWQEKAREEVLQVFGQNKPDLEGLNHLKIVTMILYEVLRLYPPVVMYSRATYKAIKLGEICIPPEVELTLPVLLVHHDRDLWGEDAEEFKPERFVEGISKATKNRVSFFPFSYGPRICIGQSFAMIEAKMAMAMILQNFSFQLSATYAHAPFSFLTIQPQYGAQLILHKV
ncbi:hypothetical protein IFM89_006988 [Coptis chinensis]|uniref:Cytochrome P450 n=1 Tax=Coptis chinensis TaxID=261450 RepID=A0A835HB44_9MAGN|nr:hypothetical protein IFM89_006988 [Coptis chinensis]